MSGCLGIRGYGDYRRCVPSGGGAGVWAGDVSCDGARVGVCTVMKKSMVGCQWIDRVGGSRRS